MCSYLENSLVVPQKFNQSLLHVSAIPLLGIHPRELKTLCSYKNSLTDVHNSIIQNSEKMETNVHLLMKRSTNFKVYPYNRILFTHKKESVLITCYNMDEPGEH